MSLFAAHVVWRRLKGGLRCSALLTNRFFAIEDRCPHKGGPLGQGMVHGAQVTCPLHNWVISLETGKALGADEGSVRTFALKVEGGKLLNLLRRTRQHDRMTRSDFAEPRQILGLIGSA